MTHVLAVSDQNADALLADFDDALAVALWVAHWVEQFDTLAPLAPERIEGNDGKRTSKSVPG